MDVKSLAKSKRDHTRQHNKKHHGNHKLKAQSHSSPSPGPNDAKEQVNEKKTNLSRVQGSSYALPGNWDRYEEEELDSVPESGETKTLDVVVPKSKGADFRHLVAEAQSHADKTLDDFNQVLPWEFGVGLSSILAIRGEGIASWVGDDNFVVQDKTSANQEASFISLNLHAIAEKLAKVDLSKRLFIESDLLPSELHTKDLAVGSDEEADGRETTEDSELAKRMSKELNLDDFEADQFTSSSSGSSSRAASTSALSDDFLNPVNNINVEFQQVGSSGKIKAFQPSAETNLLPIEDTVGKHSTFEAAAAEKDLDMLLDSLDETKSNTSFPVSLGISSTDLPRVSNKQPLSSRIASITSSLDDALDDLLDETSTLVNPNVLRPQEEPNSLLSSHSQNKSIVSDDFDSWFDTL